MASNAASTLRVRTADRGETGAVIRRPRRGFKSARAKQDAAMIATSRLAAKRVLVVEDEYLIAMDMSAYLESAGAHVVGPASSVDAALDVLQRTELDGAILDVNLRGEMAYPVADALAARGIPFVFTTGYDARMVPARFADVRRCEKPATPEAISQALFG
jgi:CheY-like chemotaxis protein